MSFHLDIPGSTRIWVTGDPNHIEEIMRNRDLVGGRGTRFLQPVVGTEAKFFQPV